MKASIEVFFMGMQDFLDSSPGTWMRDSMAENDAEDLVGWYYWYCQPGCLPDSDAIGPFPTDTEAFADAEENEE